MLDKERQFYEFGPFRLDPDHRVLLRESKAVPLQPKAFDVLLTLVQNSDKVVLKDDLLKTVWPETFVEESNLAQHIFVLRKTLGDAVGENRYIVTAPGRGYRFVEKVQVIGEELEELVAESHLRSRMVIEEKTTQATPRVLPSSKRPVLLGTALAILLLALGLGWRRFGHQNSVSRTTFSERQLTHNPPENRNLGGAISPDGKHVVYADVKGLHLLGVDTSELRDIPLPAEIVSKLWDVQWFSDGENLLLRTATNSEGNVLWLASIFGSTPRKLRSRAWPAATSPEGLSVAFVSGQFNEIWVMDANGENLKKVLTSEDRVSNVAWSPTGRRLAYIRSLKSGVNQGRRSFETISVDGGPSNVVFSDIGLHNQILYWMRDGRLIFARDEPHQIQAANLWEIAADPKTGDPSGKPTKITNWYGVYPSNLSVSNDGNRLVVAKCQNRNDVYVGDLKWTDTRLESPRRLTFSESRDVPSAWTRDSKAILFYSNRTGRTQIFRQELGKDSAEPLVPGLDEQTGAEPSPDGRWILYYSSEYAEGDSPPTTRLMRFANLGEIPEQVLQMQGVPSMATILFDCPTKSSGACVISRADQGHLIFYALDPIQGQGREVARTNLEQANVEGWAISPDGSRIAIENVNQRGKQISIIELGTGAEADVPLPPAWRVYVLAWSAEGNAFFLTVAAPHYQIVRIGVDGRTDVLLDRARDQWLADVTASPDGLHLAYNQQTFETNVWLLENF